MVVCARCGQDGRVAYHGPFSVVIADGHLHYREGLARAIADQRELSLVGAVGEGYEALRLIATRRPDVALVDIRLPGLGGLVISRELKDREPSLPTRVVIATTLLDRPAGLLHKALSLGAAGWLGKDTSRKEICEALIAAARGQTWLSLDPAVGVVYPLPGGPLAGVAS